MSSQGPSKEDLEMYWKTSRQYFDELANYYKTADPAYYSQFIAPFYTNPMYSAAVSKSSRGSSRVIIIIAAVFILIIGIAAAGIMIFLSSENDANTQQEPPKIEKKIGKEIDIPKIDSIKTEPPKNLNKKQRKR